MSDEELPAALEAWAPLIASGYEAPAASKAMHDAAARIRALIAERDEVRAILAATDIVSLPDDYPLARMAADRMARIKDLTLDGLAQIGRWEKAEAEVARLDRVAVAAWEFLSDWKKGDFSLSTLAALDAQSMLEAMERLIDERATLATEDRT